MGRSNPPPMALPPALNIHFFRLSPPLSLKSAPTPQSPPLRSDQSQLQPQPQPQPQPFNFVSNLKASLQNILSFNSFAPSVPPVPPVTDPSPPTCCTVPLFRPYVAKVPWHGGPRALLSRLFPRYGHYCGPNWSSGKEAGSMLWDRRPIDWLDHCCYCHDIGYDTHDQAKLLKSDLAFLECLERPRMATKGGAYTSIIYRAMCIAGLRSFLIPYRTHLVRLQSGPSLFDYFGNVFAKIPSISKVTGENQKGQDLWEIVGGDEIEPPPNSIRAYKKWKVKAGRALFVLKATVDKSLLTHIEDVETPKEAWDVFAALFSRKNTSRLQLLERELMNISQGDKTVSEYFLKVKNLCREIEQLDANAKIGEDRMRRIILNGMRPEYSAFITAIQGWATQPTLLELENLLASQEALAKQLAGLTVKHEEEKALYSGRRGESSRDRYRRQPETEHHEQCKRCSCSRGAPRGQEGKGAEIGEYRSRRVDCYNCGRRGHYARECRFRKNEGSFMVTAKEKAPEEVPSEEEWDAVAAVAMQSVTDVEDVEEADELEDEEIDFESWFFEEPVEKETGVVRCAVANEKKPQESTELKAITKEGDDDEMTHGSVIVEKKAAEQEFVQGHATCQENRREKRTRQLVPRQCERKIPGLSLLKKNTLEDRPKTSEQFQTQKIKRNNKKHDDPDKRGVPKIKTASSRC